MENNKTESVFSPVGFMRGQKDNQKTVISNMLELGASKESAEYAIHIINSQERKIKRKKEDGAEKEWLIEKIQNQRKEIKSLNALLHKPRFAIIIDEKVFLTNKINKEAIKKAIDGRHYEGYENNCCEFIINDNEISYFDQVDWERKYIEVMPVEAIDG